MVANDVVLVTKAVDVAVLVAVHVPSTVSVATGMVVHWALTPGPFARE